MNQLTPKDLLKYRLQAGKLRTTAAFLYDTLWELKTVEVITTEEHDRLLRAVSRLNQARYDLQDAIREANYQLYLLDKQGATS